MLEMEDFLNPNGDDEFISKIMEDVYASADASNSKEQNLADLAAYRAEIRKLKKIRKEQKEEIKDLRSTFEFEKEELTELVTFFQEEVRLRITLADLAYIQGVLAMASEEDKAAQDGTVDMELRNRVHEWLEKRGMHSAQGFISLYSCLDKSIQDDFYRIWNNGKWATEMGEKYGLGPVSWEWKKLDLCVSNKFWRLLTAKTMEIMEKKKGE